MTDSSKQKAPGLAGHEGFQKDSSKRSNFSRFSTSVEAQQARLTEALGRRSCHSQELRALGIYHPAGRVKELRRMGYVIDMQRITIYDPWGFPHRGVALYSLVSEPGA